MKRSRLRRTSCKRAAQLLEYAKLRRVYLLEHPICERCLIARSVEIHHQKGRWSRLLLLSEFWKAVCRPCHDQLHHK